MPEMETMTAGSPVGRYEILSLLSAGGMGELYLARDPELGRELVIKLLPKRGVFHPDALERFSREARAASALNHPNIVTVYEVGESPSGNFIAMELVEGRTLRELRSESPSVTTVARIGAQAARALAVAHAAGIIHRDIKPDNLMLRDDGYLKVLDFGIAQLSQGDGASGDRDSRITHPGMVVGTMRYMSPEQASGHAVTPASDVFSLGLVLYELAAGRHPFDSSSDMAVLSGIILRQPVPPSRYNSRLPGALDSLILRMLAKSPADRPQPSEVDEVLDGIVALQSTGRHATTAINTPSGVIGRESELAALVEAFDSAQEGRPVLMCISGEPGIGKTTLVEAFLRGLSGSRPHAVALGRCSERLAGSEAYLPLLDAIDDLLHGHGGTGLTETLHRLAPTWSRMLTGSVSSDTGEISPQSQERMKRELAAFLEEVSTKEPLVLLIEDIHWADVSTVDVLGYILTRMRGARLLTIATYRPAELHIADHPFLQLKLDLQTRGSAREIPLHFLSEESVGRFISDRFPENRFPGGFTGLVHSRTEGSPLFVEDLLRYLRSRGAIRQSDGRWEIAESLPDLSSDIPESMRSMVERKIGQLAAADRNLLAAASVQGHTFDSATVARALGQDAAEVEDRLESLDRVHGFVRRAGEREFPSGELSGRYRFVHVLYQNSLYASLAVSRRVALSRAVGEAILSLHGGNPGPAAAELGFLFETAREMPRAAGYFAMAAQAAVGVFGFDEASRLARRAIALLGRQSPAPDLKGLELGLQLILGSSAAVLGGYAAPEAMSAMERARVLAEELGDAPQLAPALWGLQAYNLVRGDIVGSLDIAQHALDIAQGHGSAMALTTAHADMGISLRFTGRFAEALDHFEKAEALYDHSQQREYLESYHMDPGVFSHSEMTRALWSLGLIDRAIATKEKAITFARSSPDPRTISFALLISAVLHHLLREPDVALEYSNEGIAIAEEHQIALEHAWISTSRGWALTQLGQVEEGIAEMEASIAMRKRMNAILDLPFAFSQLAEGFAARGDIERARSTLLDAVEMGQRNTDLWYQAEIQRQLGDLALAERKADDAGKYYRRSLEIAREQGGRSPELRTSVSLARLLVTSGKSAEAAELLGPIRDWFRAQRATVDFIAAEALLEQIDA